MLVSVCFLWFLALWASTWLSTWANFSQRKKRRYPKNSSGTYCLKLTNSFFLDSALSRGVGSLANHPGKGTKPNVKFVVCTWKRSARLEVIEKVKAGDEIFVSYGDDYWKDAKNSTHFAVDVPDWEWDDSDPFAAPVSCPPTLVALAPPAVVVGTLLHLSASAVLLPMWSPHLNLFLLPRPAVLLLLIPLKV
jgi:hypothetical protein